MEELNLLEHVKALENKNRVNRGNEIYSRLKSLGVNVRVQKWLFPQMANFIVDFSPDVSKRHLLFSGHYDAVKNSPGANDNASSVAVLLGLCQELRDVSVPVRVVFFDREEAWFRTPFLRLGLLGSLYYVLRNKLSNIEGVYNLEFCGLGDSLAIWPINEKGEDIAVVQFAEKAATKLNTNIAKAQVPKLLLGSDHLSFRLAGVSNAVTLSLLPEEQLAIIKKFISDFSILRLLSGRVPELPGVIAMRHTSMDDSSQLNENSLRLMLSLLLEIVNDYKF